MFRAKGQRRVMSRQVSSTSARIETRRALITIRNSRPMGPGRSWPLKAYCAASAPRPARVTFRSVSERFRGASPALVDQAELVALRVGHRPPTETVFVKVRIWPTPSASELDDAGGSDLNVIHDDVHVHTVLHHFWLGYSLERNKRRVWILVVKIHELRWTAEPALDPDPKNHCPKGRESLRIGRVDLDPAETTNSWSQVAH